MTVVHDKSAFDKREAAFEAEYFNRKEAELVAKLKAVFRQKLDKESIARATGVTDEKTLESLIALNLDGELMSGFQLLPLVEVAWADGRLDRAEAAAVLAAAEKRGVAPGSRAHAFLSERLDAGASPDLHRAWLAFAGQLRSTLSQSELETFREDVVDLCRSVAGASGGVGGRLFAVSGAEKKVLAEVEAALTS